MKKYEFGLCEARHEMPVDKFLFGNELNPVDFDSMRETAAANIPDDADELDVYVTGLTAAMLAVVDICERRKIGLTAYHFNRATGEYAAQRVLSYERCPFCKARYAWGSWVCPSCGAT